MTRWSFTLAIVLAFSGTLAAQPPRQPAPKPSPTIDPKVEAEKHAKQATLADQALADAAGLKLGENRAIVFAKVGGLIWKSDKKAAQALFDRSITDLIGAQMQAEADDKGKLGPYSLRVMPTIRPVVLDLVAKYDAEFALESLYRSRTAAIQRAMTPVVETSGKAGDSSMVMSLVGQSEFNLEQRLIRLAAEQNPELAAKLLQDSIKKGLSNETLGMLKKLFEKDPELANSLAADVLDRLMSSNFAPSPADQSPSNLAMTILNDFLRDKKPGGKELKFDDMAIRSLANKLISYYVGQDPRSTGGRISQLIKIAEKLSPGSVAALKKVEKSSMPPGMGNMAPNSDARKVTEANLSPAQMLAEAKKLPDESRGPIYQGAANKMSQAGDIAGAMQLLNSNLSGPALENAVNSLNWFYASVLMNQGKWSEAERLIDEMPDSNRRAALVTLASKSFAKDPVENKSYALSVLRKVRALLPDRVSSQNDLTQLVQLTVAYAGIDADEAFSSIEPIVPLLNEIADANAIVQEFGNNGSVRSGEFLMQNGGTFGFYFDQNLIRTLAKADFDRAQKLIDSLMRREMRINIRLQLAESGLN